MFSGIVEACASVSRVEPGDGVLRIFLSRPTDFNDLKAGDSVAVNGVCLTIEEPLGELMRFALAAETLQLTRWKAETLKGRSLNVERSLRWNDRIHGHLVTGHVDGVGSVKAIQAEGSESRRLWIKLEPQLMPYLWSKGSVALNGVSLTVNRVEQDAFEVCLIPETLKRTNLESLAVGDEVLIEVDNMARGLVNWLKQRGSSGWN